MYTEGLHPTRISFTRGNQEIQRAPNAVYDVPYSAVTLTTRQTENCYYCSFLEQCYAVGWPLKSEVVNFFALIFSRGAVGRETPCAEIFLKNIDI